MLVKEARDEYRPTIQTNPTIAGTIKSTEQNETNSYAH